MIHDIVKYRIEDILQEVESHTDGLGLERTVAILDGVIIKLMEARNKALDDLVNSTHI